MLPNRNDFGNNKENVLFLKFCRQILFVIKIKLLILLITSCTREFDDDDEFLSSS